MDVNSTRTLASGNKMPVMGLGTWQLTNDTAGTIQTAIDLGYPMIDTSGDYGTQLGIGEGFRRSKIARDELYIVTKVEEDEDAYQSSVKNLGELGIDYANLILIHRPPKTGVGEELWEGLRRARDEGLTRDIGVSNYSIEQIQELADKSGEMPAVNQIEWSPFGYSERMFAFCQENRIILQAYSPLTRTKRLDNEMLLEIGAQHGKDPAQVLIRWNLQRGTVPLPKANQRQHLETNIDVFDFELTPYEMTKLDELNEHYSSLGGLPYV